MLFNLEVAIVFISMLIVLVAAHEYGHYLFARVFGMGIEEFAIGMGGGSKPLTIWKRLTYLIPVKEGEDPYHRSLTPNLLEGGGVDKEPELVEVDGKPFIREETVFTIRPFPIGGFVRIKGMIPEEDGGETKIPGGFYSKAPWQRFIVLLAGPMFSVIAGVLLLVLTFTVHGLILPNQPVIGGIAKDMPAAKVFEVGDRVTSIAGHPVKTWFDVVSVVRDSANKPLEVEYVRKGVARKDIITPALDSKPTPLLTEDLAPSGEVRIQGKLGVVPGGDLERVSVSKAFGYAVKAPLEAAKGLLSTFLFPSTFKDNVGGPGMMVSATASQLKQGPWNVIELAGILSISVGIFNLLPVVPLDGGQMAVAIVEMFRSGRRISFMAQEWLSRVGFSMLLLLVCAVLITDASRLFDKSPEAKPAPGKKAK